MNVQRLCLLLSILMLSACKLTVTNNGGGVVTSEGGHINCGSQCEVDSSELNNSSNQSAIVLTATPDEGYEFVGWTGDCSGTGDCVIEITGTSGNREVTATFDEIPLKELISAGAYHVCQQGPEPLVCWGGNQYGQADLPQDLPQQVEAIYSGSMHSCAETNEGLKCWGAGGVLPSQHYSYGQSIVPESIQFPDRVALGWYHTCAIENGTVECWGFNEHGQTDVPEGLVNPREISAGRHHTCAIDDTGVICWGAGTIDQGEYPHHGQSIVPDTVINPSTIDLGDERSCVLQNEEVICWGENLSDDVASPTLSGPIDRLSVGGEHLCAIANDELSCWGNNYFGQSEVPANLGNISSISTFTGNTCVMANNSPVCWGRNQYGSNNVPGSVPRPEKIVAAENRVCALGESQVNCWGFSIPDLSHLSNVQDLGIGSNLYCFIDDNGLSCSGYNNHQQSTVPEHLINSARKIATGFDHNCVIKQFGEVECWGDDWDGQSTPPLDLTPVSTLVADKDTSCALQTDSATCWGDLASQALSNPSAIDISQDHGCAIDDNGLVCWGRDVSGKLEVPELTNPRDVSVGYDHSCALDDNGIKCWGAGSENAGSNMNYQQGIVPSEYLVNPRDVEAALSTTCALDDIGVRCWGFQNFKVITR